MAIFDEPSRKPIPQPTFEDMEHAGRKGLASIIPFVGGTASELLGLLASPVARRRDDWLSDLQRRLQDLEGRVEGFRFDDLENNEQFVSATLQAMQAAVKTHQQEKLEALRNAVLNVAAGTAPDEYLESVFLQLVDSFTVYHLRLLALFNTQTQVRIADAPEWLKSGIGFQLAKELLDRGLLETRNHLTPDPHKLIVGKDGVYTFHAQLARLGNQFLSFITEPTVKRNES